MLIFQGSNFLETDSFLIFSVVNTYSKSETFFNLINTLSYEA